MIKHIVMFKLSENADGKTKKENLDTALEMLKNFKAADSRNERTSRLLQIHPTLPTATMTLL